MFSIWIDRLKEGQVQKIEGVFDPSFLGVDEEELQFPHSVSVEGQAYIANTHLVIYLKASTQALMPCSICNVMTLISLKNEPFYHSEPLSAISGGVFDFTALLREALLIELPQYVECSSGSCPERSSLAPYLHPPSDDQSHHPFRGIGSV